MGVVIESRRSNFTLEAVIVNWQANVTLEQTDLVRSRLSEHESAHTKRLSAQSQCELVVILLAVYLMLNLGWATQAATGPCCHQSAEGLGTARKVVANSLSSSWTGNETRLSLHQFLWRHPAM